MAQTEEAVYYQGDQTLIDFTPGADVAAGDVEAITTGMPGIWGVANIAITSGELGALDISGIYKFKKAAAGAAHTAGDVVEWDISEGDVVALADAAGNGRLGIVVESALIGADFVICKINMQQQPAT